MVKQLAELNSYVNVYLRTEELSEAEVEQNDLVILIGSDEAQQLKLSSWCRAHKKALILADVKGKCGIWQD